MAQKEKKSEREIAIEEVREAAGPITASGLKSAFVILDEAFRDLYHSRTLHVDKVEEARTQVINVTNFLDVLAGGIISVYPDRQDLGEKLLDWSRNSYAVIYRGNKPVKVPSRDKINRLLRK